MAKCINQIINRDVKVRGPVTLSSNVAGSSKIDDENFFESFKDSIEGATKRLRTVDCSQVVLDFFSDTTSAGIEYTTGYKVETDIGAGYNWVSNNVNLQTAMQKLGGLGDKLSSKVGFDVSKITSIFCVTITNIFRNLVFFIENALKVAIGLFKVIDKYLYQLENAIQDFLDSVRDCIITVIVDAKLALNKLVNNILDFDIVIQLMETCPCVTEIFASIFNCKDDDGNKLTEPGAVLECMVDKFSINPDDLLGPINDFIDDTLISNIQLGYNVLQESIALMMELLITPLRELVKGYCFLLTEKINVTFLIKTLGPSKCLLVYTPEVDDSGREYEGMNILDMINTMKLWTGCFEFVCAPFIEDTKLSIKDYQEKFRLDAKYWNNVFTLDIYTSCVMVHLQGNTTRPTAIREVYAANVGKGKDVFTGIVDVFKDLGEIAIESAQDERNIGEVYESIRSKEGPDEEETPIVQGNQNYFSGVEDKVIAVTRNLGSAINDEPNYERYMNLLTWETRYRKQQLHIEMLNQIKENYRTGTAAVPDTREASTAIDDTDTNRVTEGLPQVNFGLNVPSYVMPVDYDSVSSEEIQASTAPKKNKNENLVAYYDRWFNEIGE